MRKAGQILECCSLNPFLLKVPSWQRTEKDKTHALALVHLLTPTSHGPVMLTGDAQVALT